MPVTSATGPGLVLPPTSRPAVLDPPAIERFVAPFGLRDDQRDAVVALLQHRGYGVPAVDMPTGTGKTRVGAAVAAYHLSLGNTVLWVCHRRRLLEQAADTVRQLCPALADRVTWLDRERRPRAPLPGGRLVFATTQTWAARQFRLPPVLSPPSPLVVVWDEVHWAFDTPTGQQLRAAYRDRPVFGLTATPPHSPELTVVYRRGPEDYFGGVLAVPVFEQVDTGVDWTPEVAGGEFAPAAVRTLSAHHGRNTTIVDTVVAARAAGRFRAGIVFAADIRHADELARRMAERGVPARAVHSRLPAAEQADAERLFKAGRVDVLVNVDQLTEGFDHPTTDAVFLTRPTLSRRRWTQRVGRAMRRTAGKTSFRVYDFADNLTRFASRVVRADSCFPTRLERPRGDRRLVRHELPVGEPRFANCTVPGYGELPIALGQTFGVEIELTAAGGVPDDGPEWEATAEVILEHLRRWVTGPVHPITFADEDGPLDAWRVVYDGSAGWEVVSPILMDAGGLDELSRACEAVAEAVKESAGRLRVDHRTGLHLTLAAGLTAAAQIRRLVGLVQRVEPGLFTLVAPSRLYGYTPGGGYRRRACNRYCAPLRRLGDPAALDLAAFVRRYAHRYHSVNLVKCQDEVPLLEVRMHGGTYEFRKVALWLSLWMQLFNAARFGGDSPGAGGPVLPGGNTRIGRTRADSEDIVRLLAAEGLPLTPEFERLLRDRRRELRPRWEQAVPNRVSAWEAAGWYD